ncbi:MAG: zinc dependent phospholipase C family protein [Hymenobacteraceae bacterium]|nr:zinc dependent phospholipase C family protein [Hymenobacteraceae bacterium]MDX5395738.1 zinc dependent phospholipase C family protein [Hymenobacteraceae bacterium]MDX5511792.1 zinc dependent phospholipase C family protein [Hymenobacteraceae bacterium]
MQFTRFRSFNFLLFALFVALTVYPKQVYSYGPLAHQTLLDAAWPGTIEPFLLNRYPEANQQQLLEAHAYAYGGSVIHDLGYFPYGGELYSELVHYVRSGDFIVALFEEATTINELAFAIGAMSHYYGDRFGHPVATNPAVGLLYSDTAQTCYHAYTYHDNELAHLKTELGFDMLLLARGHYAPDVFRNFTGFKIAKSSLARAFERTYGIPLHSQFLNLNLSLMLYRKTMKTYFPKITRIAWQVKHVESTEAPTQYRYLYKGWAYNVDKPELNERIIAAGLRVAPKFGPLQPLAYKVPTPQTELLFNESFDLTLQQFHLGLSHAQLAALHLPNTGLDNGIHIRPGQYLPTDETHLELLKELHKHKYKMLTPALKTYLLWFFENPEKLLWEEGDKKEKELEKQQQYLTELKAWQK